MQRRTEQRSQVRLLQKDGMDPDSNLPADAHITPSRKMGRVCVHTYILTSK